MKRYQIVDSPIGALSVVADGDAIVEVRFGGVPPELDVGGPEWRESGGLIRRAAVQLHEYFTRARKTFDLPLRPDGTEFQRRVWDELLLIPYGDMISYGELARRVGQPNASRAVGAATGKNPIPIFIPCHRVIGSRGALIGFGGGLPIKESLLQLETRQGSLFG